MASEEIPSVPNRLSQETLESMMDTLREHRVSKTFPIDYEKFKNQLSVIDTSQINQYFVLPKDIIQTYLPAPGFNSQLLLRIIVDRECIDTFQPGYLRESIASRINRRSRGYSSEALLIDLLTRANPNNPLPELKDLKGKELAEAEERLINRTRLSNTLIDSPEHYFLLGKYVEEFYVDKNKISMAEPIIIVPGAQDKEVLENYESLRRVCRIKSKRIWTVEYEKARDKFLEENELTTGKQ